MAQMLIRNLDPRLVSELKRRASQNRTSAEEEARRALAHSLGSDRTMWLTELDAIRAQSRPPGPGEETSLDWLRADRARDEGG